ncbi:uncharacterized protein LOC124361539 [Homalodisca vitripennis]|uniref:uncharacterized protein LOC124361539 n=1 Tax=Homalodisca vitripennis TaxID=197043 RepID=UPI001EEA6028|nr:uncharacterized protein LOC124361539 [Homalodisca vitripennis]
MWYMENTWMQLIGPETFSVFGQCHRTNNAFKMCFSREWASLWSLVVTWYQLPLLQHHQPLTTPAVAAPETPAAASLSVATMPPPAARAASTPAIAARSSSSCSS